MKIVLKTVFLVAAVLGVVIIATPSFREWIKSLFPPKPSPCGAPTLGPATATMIPGIAVMGDNVPLTGTAHIKGTLDYPIKFTNVTNAATTIDAIRLYESIDHKFIPQEELNPECQYMGISGGDCAPASLPVTLAPNASCTVMIRIRRPQTGYLNIQTGLGLITIPISAMP